MAAFLILGDISFANEEIPEQMPFGGDQNTYIHKFLGGEREIHPMGRDDRDIEWSGLFFGSTAAFRAKYLDGVRVEGKPLNLLWSQFSYTVVVKQFEADYVRDNVLPYTIKVEIVQDLNKPFPVLLPVTYDFSIKEIMQEAQDLAAAIASGTIEGQLAAVAFALDQIADIGNATASEIAKVTGPLNSLSKTISDSIDQVSGGIF